MRAFCVFFCWGWGSGEQDWAWKAGFVARKLMMIMMMMMMMRVGVAAENAAKELQCTDIR